jgi:probable rRNA maturation factor
MKLTSNNATTTTNSMYRIQVQRAIRNVAAPTSNQFRQWASAALKDRIPAAEITIRIVDEKEMLALNSTYRHKHKTTNVLSFPFSAPPDITLEIPLLGDLVICAAVVKQEAIDQHKTETEHWAHMVVHGTLHLLGYDHEVPAEADIMEALETTILQQLGFDNPYEQTGR